MAPRDEQGAACLEQGSPLEAEAAQHAPVDARVANHPQLCDNQTHLRLARYPHAFSSEYTCTYGTRSNWSNECVAIYHTICSVKRPPSSLARYRSSSSIWEEMKTTRGKPHWVPQHKKARYNANDMCE